MTAHDISPYTRTPVFYLAHGLLYLLVGLTWLVYALQLVLILLSELFVILDELFHRAHHALLRSRYVTTAWRDERLHGTGLPLPNAKTCLFGFLTAVKRGLGGAERLLDRATSGRKPYSAVKGYDELDELRPSVKRPSKSSPVRDTPPVMTIKGAAAAPTLRQLSANKLVRRPLHQRSAASAPTAGPFGVSAGALRPYSAHRTASQSYSAYDDDDDRGSVWSGGDGGKRA